MIYRCKQFCIGALSNAGGDVLQGTVEIAVSFMGLPIFSQSEDLCSKTACPVAAGPINITLVELLPPIAPPVSRGPLAVAAAAAV